MSFYKKVLTHGCGIKTCTGIILISSTASPNSMKAAFDTGLPVYVLMDRPKPHQLYHRDEMMIENFMPSTYKGSPRQTPDTVADPQAAVDLSTRPQYQQLKAPGSLFELTDIAPKYSTDPYAGVDLTYRQLSNQALPNEEAQLWNLELRASKVVPSKMGVFANRRFEDPGPGPGFSAIA